MPVAERQQTVFTSAGDEAMAIFSVGRLPEPRAAFNYEGDYLTTLGPEIPLLLTVRSCRHCGCTQDDCSQCIERTGDACSWVSLDECSACVLVSNQ